MTTTSYPTESLRQIDPQQVIRQIRRMDLLATSGGRWSYDDHSVVLPVRYGYRVVVTLSAADLYNVERVHVSGTRVTVKGRVEGVFAEDLSEQVYRAGCYHDAFGEEVAA